MCMILTTNQIIVNNSALMSVRLKFHSKIRCDTSLEIFSPNFLSPKFGSTQIFPIFLSEIDCFSNYMKTTTSCPIFNLLAPIVKLRLMNLFNDTCVSVASLYDNSNLIAGNQFQKMILTRQNPFSIALSLINGNNNNKSHL